VLVLLDLDRVLVNLLVGFGSPYPTANNLAGIEWRFDDLFPDGNPEVMTVDNQS
jgi:hypothetical protein